MKPLTAQERQIMADIYKSAGLKKVRVTSKNASRIHKKHRKEF